MVYGRTTYPCSAPTNVVIPFASRTVCCPPEPKQKTPVGPCCPVVIPDTIQAQAESSRIASKVKSVFTTVPTYPNCVNNNGGASVQQSTSLLTPGAPIPYASTGAPAASKTVQSKAAQVVAASTNPYNPTTRFAQYFPKQPPLFYCETPRYVKADTLPSVNTCRPIQRFTGIPNALLPPG